jgi:zinc protease
MLETIGLPWQIKDEYVDKILAVTAEQVQQVAKKYLTDENLTVAVLDPLPIENDNGENVADDSVKQMPATGGVHGQ